MPSPRSVSQILKGKKPPKKSINEMARRASKKKK